MNIKKGLIATFLAALLVLGGSISTFAATDYDLTQSYADSIKGDSYQAVVDTLGEPDYSDEIDLEGLGTIISATWTDGNYNTLTVSTDVDGQTIESVIFGSAGDLDDVTTVDADLEGAYSNIKSGMSYNEVVAIVGAEGTEGASSTASFGDEITSTASVYTWMTDDFTILSIAFSDDRMIAKTLVTSSGEVLMDYADEEVSSEEPGEEPGEEPSNDDGSNENSTSEESSTNNDVSNGETPTTDVQQDEDKETEVNKNSTDEEQEGGKLPDTNAGIPMGLLAGLGATIIGAFGLRRKK